MGLDFYIMSKKTFTWLRPWFQECVQFIKIHESLQFWYVHIPEYMLFLKVNIHDGIALSHKKKHIWISFNEVDETRTYCTEWSKSEIDKYHFLMHIYGIQKNGTEEFIPRAAMEKQT